MSEEQQLGQRLLTREPREAPEEVEHHVHLGRNRLPSHAGRPERSQRFADAEFIDERRNLIHDTRVRDAVDALRCVACDQALQHAQVRPHRGFPRSACRRCVRCRRAPRMQPARSRRAGPGPAAGSSKSLCRDVRRPGAPVRRRQMSRRTRGDARGPPRILAVRRACGNLAPLGDAAVRRELNVARYRHACRDHERAARLRRPITTPRPR